MENEVQSRLEALEKKLVSIQEENEEMKRAIRLSMKYQACLDVYITNEKDAEDMQWLSSFLSPKE